jgi:hypothetical protein
MQTSAIQCSNHMWNVANVTQELTFNLVLIKVKLNLKKEKYKAFFC